MVFDNALHPLGQITPGGHDLRQDGGGIPGLCRVMDVELSTELAFTSIAPEDLKPQSLAALTIARMPALIASGSSSGQVVAELGLGDVAAIQTA